MLQYAKVKLKCAKYQVGIAQELAFQNNMDKQLRFVVERAMISLGKGEHTEQQRTIQ